MLRKLDRARNLLFAPDLRLQKPIVLQFPVNDVCNSRCQMCNIWQIKQKKPISIDQVRQGLSRPLFSRVQTIGINGGEPTLRKDLPQLVAALFETLPALEKISLITNAINADQVRRRIEGVSDVVRGAGGSLDVMVSVDGVGTVHDAVRGRPDNFSSAVQVLEWLKRDRVAETIRIGCTVIRENVYGVHDLHRFAQDIDIYVKYRLGILHQRLYNEGGNSAFELTVGERIHLATFLECLVKDYEKDPRQRLFYKSLVGQIRYGAPRAIGCDWQHRGATLNSYGEVLYCAVASPVITDIESPEIERDYFAKQSIIEEIRASKCDGCAHDYVGSPKAEDGRRLLLQKIIDHSGQRENLANIAALTGFNSWVRRRRFEAKKAAMNKTVVAPATDEVIVICGWYGTETLGDKAILAGIVSAIRAVDSDRAIVVASLDVDYTAQTVAQMGELNGVRSISYEVAYELASSAIAVIMGGGPLMDVDEIMKVRRLFQIAADHSCPAIIAGCGIGPLKTRYHTPEVAQILDISSLSIFRDASSAYAAKKLAPASVAPHVTCDPAISWLARKADDGSAGPARDLVLGLRAFPWTEYAPELGRTEARRVRDRLDQAIADALAGLVATDQDLVLRPVPMCTNATGGDDRFYYDHLFRLRPELKDRVDWTLLSRELSPDQYLSVFRSARAALAMRFHSLVFSLHSRLPTVAIDYTLGEGKVASLAESAGIRAHNPRSISAVALQGDLSQALGSACQDPAGIIDTFRPVFVRELRRILA